MSATLDLNGMTVTLLADSVNYYYQITDSSIGHAGLVIMEPGSSIVFDDAAGAGFDPLAAITMHINGNSTSPCEIRSASLDPTNKWTMLVPTDSVIATRCVFRNYVPPFTAPAGWTINNCTFDYEIPTTPPYSFDAWFPHRVSIENQQGYGSRGSPTYGAPLIVNCYLSYKLQNVLGPEGNDIVSDTYLLVDGTVTVAPYDRITLPDGTVRPVKNVGWGNMPAGQTVLKVVFL